MSEMTKTKEYHAWRDMKRRCDPNNTNPRNRWHREKGIKVCEEWLNSFQRFLADIGYAPTKKHTLDRIDYNGNYEPSNCRWATAKEQANNRSGQNTKMFTFNGITMNMTDWNASLGFAETTIQRRMKMGWSVEDAFTKPKGYCPKGNQFRKENAKKARLALDIKYGMKSKNHMI